MKAVTWKLLRSPKQDLANLSPGLKLEFMPVNGSLGNYPTNAISAYTVATRGISILLRSWIEIPLVSTNKVSTNEVSNNAVSTNVVSTNVIFTKVTFLFALMVEDFDALHQSKKSPTICNFLKRGFQYITRFSLTQFSLTQFFSYAAPPLLSWSTNWSTIMKKTRPSWTIWTFTFCQWPILMATNIRVTQIVCGVKTVTVTTKQQEVRIVGLFYSNMYLAHRIRQPNFEFGMFSHFMNN